MKNGLLTNENIKLWRQTSTRVIVIILAVLCVLIPLAPFLLNLLSYNYTPEDSYDRHIEMAEYYQRDDTGYGEVESKSGYAYWMAKAEAIKFFIDNDIAEGWKYSMYYDEFNILTENLAGYRLIATGVLTYEELMSSNWFYSMRWDFQTDGEGDYREDGGEKIIIDPKTGEYYYASPDSSPSEAPSDEDILDKYAELLARHEQLKEEILRAEFKQIIAGQITSLELELAGADAARDAARSEAESNPDDSSAQYMYELSKLRSEAAEEKLRLYRLLYDKSVDGDSWQYNTVRYILDRVQNERMSSVPIPEDQHSNWGGPFEISYKQYLKMMEKQRANADAALAVIKYSLENDIPTPQTLGESTKLSWQNNIPTAVGGYIVIFMIIVGGSIMTGEYSSGSIRLLLIRPRKRSRILTSKLLCLTLWSGVIMVAAALLMLAINLIIYGLTDIFVPDLVYLGGRVLPVSGFITALWSLFVNSLPNFLFAALALLFSLLAKKAALSIALPLIANAIGGAIASLAGELSSYFPWLSYTIFPYLSMSRFKPGILGNYAYNYSFMDALVGGGTGGSSDAMLGVVMLLLHTALMVFFSYLTFNKQQIKN